jgi:hypothetical protein
MRFDLLLLVALALSAAVSAQKACTVSPEEAASHLIHKVDPVYPPFAKAAGIEGVVHIGVGICASGYICEINRLPSGPPSLTQAAKDALDQYVYRPFEEAGHPVKVTTTVDVAFQLGEGQHRPRVFPVPRLSSSDLTWLEDAHSTKGLPVQFREWLNSRIDRYWQYESQGYSGLSTREKTEKKEELAASIVAIELPINKRGTHLYFVSATTLMECGNPGLCPIEIVEQNATGIRLDLSETGRGFYAYRRPSAVYPDLFFASRGGRGWHMIGYANVDGMWGPFYCGEIKYGADTMSEIHNCR